MDAGPDQFACASGDIVSLSGSISGTSLGFSWTPTVGLSDPFSLSPTATVTGPFTYTLTGFAEDPNAANLLANPDFEGGNFGFSSNFGFTPTPVSPGTYFITTSPSLVISNFPPCDDHTFGNGTGNMMLINGTGSIADVWCQTVTVNPNSFYVMSGWATSSPISSPELQFSVNGTLVGSPFASSGSPCGWEQFSAAWFSGAAASATICVTDQSTSGNGMFGDDFALDDLFFAEACSQTDEVMVDLLQVEAILPNVIVLPCDALPAGILLDGSASSSGPNISYQWTTTNGNILSGGSSSAATVDMEGLYTLTVTFDNGTMTCTDEATIEVLPDPDMVEATAFAPDAIDCSNPTVFIDGTGSSAGAGISYQWTPLAGIVSGQTTNNPEVAAAGTYTLLVTNSTSGCTAMADVLVSADTTHPIANANVPGILTCLDTTLLLSGLGSSTGSAFSYQWTAIGSGHILAGANTLNGCEIDEPGIYQLLVTNDQNGCTASAFVTVEENMDLPTALAQAPTGIDCNNQTAALSGNGSSAGAGITYLWTTTDGNIQNGATSLEATAGSGGQYLLTVFDSGSGCSASDTVFVSENTAAPAAMAASPDTITCLLDSLQLTGNGSSSGAAYTYLWTTGNGNILSGNTALAPQVDAPGTYLLTVTDTVNGCTASASATVFSDTAPPISEAGQPVTIGCDGSPEMLDGNGSSTGPGFTYLWTTNNGNILSGETTLSPEVNAAGIYFISTTNSTNGCVSTDSVLVDADGNAPTAVASVADTLDCSTPQLAIDASASSAGAGISISWTSPDGLFVSGQTTLQPVVAAGGIYTLTLTDTSSNCSASISVNVEQDTASPQINIVPPGMLNCRRPIDTLDASASSQGAGFTQNWTTADGHFVAGAMTLQPVIDSAGFYILKIINSVNDCMSIDSVNVAADFALPLADAGPPRTIDCNSPQVTLDGTGSSQGGQYIYQWFPLSGNIVSGGMGLQPVVDASGLYLLEVTDSGNGCSASSTVAVDTQADFPQVAIELPGALGCSVPQVGLIASAPAAPGIVYLWTTANGNIVSGDTSLMPVVDAAGNYTLTVTDANNGCSASATVEVLQNNNAPTAVAGIPFTLPCGANSAFLDGTGSELGFEIFYEWTTPNGHILAGANTLTPEINAPGTYILAVTDGLNGCAGTDTVLVSLDNNAPVADAGLPDTLTCDSPSLLLDGSGSDSGSNIAYSWTTPDGNIVSGSTGPTPQVDAPGTYLLTVLDTGNNCETIASVQVAQVTDGPPISLADAPLLSCTDTLLTLSGSAAGSNVDYLWTAITGHIVAGETTASPSIDAAGSYLFTATDRTTGCTSDTTLLVLENTDPPTALATSPLPLDCGQTELVLDATASSSGPGFGYLWTTQNGNFASGETSATPVVTAPGDYLLQVTDLDNGCTATAAVEVTGGGNLPVVSILPPNELTCILQEIAIDASNSTFAAGDLFEWTTPDGNIVSGASTLTPTADAPGTYTLSIANPQNGCSATDSIIILQNTNAPQAAAGADLVLGCDGSAIQIQGSLLSPPDAVLDWVFAPAAGVSGNPFVAGGQTATPLVNLPGSYSLTATDPSNGCVFMDEMSISPGGIGGFSFVVGQPNCSSPTGSILFADVQGGLPPFAYSIDGTDFSPQAFFDGLPPGNYALTLRDSNGCEAVWQAQIIDFQPFEIILDATASLPLGTSIPLNAQTTLPLDEIAGIVWTPGEGLSCTACLRPFASPSANTDYVLTITDSSGCSATAGIHLLVTEPKIEVFVPNAFSPNGDGINDVLVLFANGQLVQRVGQFRIFGRWGEAVFEAFDFPPNDFLFGWDGRHRGQLMEPGVFVWLAEIVLADGQRRVLEGEVVLLR